MLIWKALSNSVHERNARPATLQIIHEIIVNRSGEELQKAVDSIVDEGENGYVAGHWHLQWKGLFVLTSKVVKHL